MAAALVLAALLVVTAMSNTAPQGYWVLAAVCILWSCFCARLLRITHAAAGG